MTRTSDDATQWQGLLPRPASAAAMIRVAVKAQDATWFAEVPVVFLDESD